MPHTTKAELGDKGQSSAHMYGLSRWYFGSHEYFSTRALAFFGAARPFLHRFLDLFLPQALWKNLNAEVVYRPVWTG